MRKTLVAAQAVCLLIASHASAQNLVENPSFELPTVTSGSANDVWFRFGSGAGGVCTESTLMPRTGLRHMRMDLIGQNQFAGVLQNLNMTINPGDVISFTGWTKGNSAPFFVTQEIQLVWQGSPNPPPDRLDILNVGSNYAMFSHTGKAPAGTTGLVVVYAVSSFNVGQGDASVFLDDVTVTLAVCYPDCTDDGALTVADFGCFQTKFVASDPYADCDGGGTLTVADFGCFQTKFVAGCP